MRINVYGLTESTITFSTLNMILRGKYSEDPEECGLGSAALNIELNNQDEINEMNQIEGLGLIRIERLDEVKEETEAEIKTYADEIFVEDTTSRRQKAQELEEQPPPSNVSEVPPSAVDLEIPQEDLTESTGVIVMTENGPKSGKMVHKMNGEINEDDPRCKAAMDETKRLKEEEERLDDLIDDSVLDPSERMGSTAVVGTGNGKAETMSMKNSAVGEKIEPNFIDLEFDDEPTKPAKKKAKPAKKKAKPAKKKAKKEKPVDVSDAFIDEEKPDSDVSDAFIDLGEEEEDEALGEEFIEI